MKKLLNLTLPDIPKTAKSIAHSLRGGEVLALVGPLGAGKTAFTQALAKRLKVKHKITSPTFVLMNIFPAVLPLNQKRISLLHLDLYRIKNYKDTAALGLNELWQKKDAVTIIEWADKIKKHLPKNAVILKFSHDESHKI